MRALQGYRICETLYSTDAKQVLRVQRESDGMPGVLKFFESGATTSEELDRIKSEFTHLEAIDSEYVVDAHDLVPFDHGVGILMEDFPGEPLRDRLARLGPLEVEDFLDIATDLTRGLRDIHQARVIHRDIKPSNILIDGDGRLKIIDFGISNDFFAEDTGHRGSMPYMSPEHSGRMNRTVDHRSDLYSLGAVFYEMLSGRPPFVRSSLEEWVHAHVAIVPDPPSRVDATIPSALVRLVLKLLEKEPDARYQSAVGLLADLEVCAAFLERGEPLPDELPLGTGDQPQVLRIPRKLYGREVEIRGLRDRFSRVARGAFEPVLVSGYSGIGKSSLIEQLQKPLAASRGFFGLGKYGQFNKATPYSAIRQALGALVRRVLRGTESEVTYWRERLQLALGDEAQCLVEVVPVLEVLIGAQPDLPETGFVGQQKRFNRNCSALLRAFATEEHPLVLALDDVQWADSASLELIRSWLEDEVPHAMVVLAYRDNEVGSDHPLTRTLAQGLAGREDSCRIHLGPLTLAHVEALMADTLRTDLDRVRGLSAALLAKTGGNPFFLIQMLRSLYEDGSIWFGRDGWTWSWEAIRERDLNDNIAALMADKLHRYPAPTAAALNMAAILGDRFELDELANVLGESSAAIRQALRPPMDDGLLDESAGVLHFSHDKVHEAAYKLVSSKERSRRHHMVGRYLLETLHGEALEARLFQVVENLNRSRDLIGSDRDHRQLIELNLQAGAKALVASAFGPSQWHFEVAVSLLGRDCWQSEPQLAFEAYYGLADASYACSRYHACEQALNICLEHVHDPVRSTPVMQMLLDVLVSQNRQRQALDLGIRHLGRLGVELPERVNSGHTLAAYLSLRARHRRLSMRHLLELQSATDQRVVAVMGMLNALVASAHIVRPELVPYFGVLTAKLSLEYGNTIYTPYGYCLCMGVAAGVFKQIDVGQEYMNLALDLRERYPDAKQKGRTELSWACFMLHQIGPVRGWEKHAHNAMTYNLDAGFVLFADYVLLFTRCNSLFFGTGTLHDVFATNVEVLQQLRTHGDRQAIACQAHLLHTVLQWIAPEGEHSGCRIPEVSGFDAEAYQESLHETSNLVAQSNGSVLRQVQQYLQGDFVGALETGMRLAPQSLGLLGNMVEHMHRYFFALAYLAADRKGLPARKRATYGAYHVACRKFLFLADKHAPNFRSNVAMLLAEADRAEGRVEEAIVHYRRAVEEAHEVSRFQELLAHRRLLSLLLEQGRVRKAREVAKEALRLSRSFGFGQETQRLEEASSGLSGIDGDVVAGEGEKSPRARRGGAHLDAF